MNFTGANLVDTLDHISQDKSGFNDDQFSGSDMTEGRESVQSSNTLTPLKTFTRKRINHKPVNLEWEPSIYSFAGLEHRDPWSGEDLSAGFHYQYKASIHGIIHSKTNREHGSRIQHVINRERGIDRRNSYSNRDRKIRKVVSLLSAYFPVSIFKHLPEMLNKLDMGPSSLGSYITITLAYVDLQLRLHRGDCLSHSVIERVSTDFNLESVNRSGVISARKNLFRLVLRGLEPVERKKFKKRYIATKKIEFIKREQTILKKKFFKNFL